MAYTQVSLRDGFDEACQGRPLERHRLERTVRLLAPEHETACQLYVGFAMTSLPHRKLKDDRGVWQRQSGCFPLVAETGFLPDVDGVARPFSVPYGPRVRPSLFYLQSVAQRIGTRIMSFGAEHARMARPQGVPSDRGMAGRKRSAGLPARCIVRAMLMMPPPADPRQARDGFLRLLRKRAIESFLALDDAESSFCYDGIGNW